MEAWLNSHWPIHDLEEVHNKRMTAILAGFRRYLRQLNLQTLRKPVVAIIGGAVVLIGIVMIVLPGPAFLVIPLGLAILAREFNWAKRWLEWIRARFQKGRKS